MIKEILSLPMEDLGNVPDSTKTALNDLVEAIVADPGYIEPGRLSKRIVLGQDKDDIGLEDFAVTIGESYLNEKPRDGSIALVSVVTNAEKYGSHTQNSKAASNWHQDFVVRERGFFFPPEDAGRLVIPTLSGPTCVVGEICVTNALKIEEVVPPQKPDRAKALESGPTVLGADEVLIKSEHDPLGGEKIETEPNRIYIIPSSNIHKAPEVLPEGRVFFQLDTV
jgi:hypothetical protein